MSNRQKTYALLSRLHNRELEVQAKTLVDLQGRIALLQQERDNLEKSRREGASVTMIEAMPYRGKFLNMMRQRSLKITQEIDSVSSQLEQQRHRVLGCYQEAKSSETLEEGLRSEQLAAQKSAEQAMLDEQILLRKINGYS